MAWFLENYGLQEFDKTEEDTRNFLSYLLHDGKAIKGYSDVHYINKHLGNAQFIIPLISNKDGDKYEIIGMDSHSSGNCVWDMLIQSDITPKDASLGDRRLLLNNASNGKGLIVSNIVNADVLPSFLENDFIKLQMIAYPVDMDIFSSEEEYAESVEETENGKKLLLDDGMIFSSGFFINHKPGEDCEKNSWMDERVVLYATIKKIYWGKIQIEDEVDEQAYIRTIVETKYGDLEIIHTGDQIKEGQFDKFEIGAKVFGVFVLSGDAAIYDYDQGCIFNKEHDLSLLRYMFETGNAERIRSALSEDICFTTVSSEKEYNGKDEVIERFDYVYKEKTKECFAHKATITSIDECDKELEYGVGKRCIVISYKEWDNYTSICFIETNEDGKIIKIKIVEDPEYHFKIDEYPSFEDEI